jgi:hypothetical protein
VAEMGGLLSFAGPRANGEVVPIAVIGQTLVNRLLTTLPGHEQPVQVLPEAEVHGGPLPATWRPRTNPLSREGARVTVREFSAG